MINYEDFFKVGEEVGFKCRYEYYWVFFGDCFLFQIVCLFKVSFFKRKLYFQYC